AVPPPTPAAPAPPPPPRTDVATTLAGALFGRVGEPLTFVATLANRGPNAATGVELQLTIPSGAKLDSATLSNGNACSSAGSITCFVGTLAAGASVTATVDVTASQTGTLTLSGSAQADYDVDYSNNAAAQSVPVVAADAPPPPPPPPAQPGTFNAIAENTVMVNGVQQPNGVVFSVSSGDSVDVTDGSLTVSDFDGGFGTFSNNQLAPRRAARRVAGRDSGGGVPA